MKAASVSSIMFCTISFPGATGASVEQGDWRGRGFGKRVLSIGSDNVYITVGLGAISGQVLVLFRLGPARRIPSTDTTSLCLFLYTQRSWCAFSCH